MNTLFRFLYELLVILFSGFKSIFEGLFNGIKMIFSFNLYKKVINYYAHELNMSEWVLTVILLIILIVVLGLIIFIIYAAVRKFLKFKKEAYNNESLLEEIDSLNDKVVQLVKENEKILELKNGVVVDENGNVISEEEGTSGKVIEELEEDLDPASEEERMRNVSEDSKRFPQLFRIDFENLNTKIVNYNNNQTLEQLVDDFRCFAASQLGLYYDVSLLRVFFSGLACGKMLILQGISGTGKTSLAYAWSKFNKLAPCVSSVQPSWRDRTDFFGYINEFTKKFTETTALVEIYSALYDDRIHTVILDEMNLARVEYYFAEVLSILEMPDRNEWLISLVTSYDRNDPKKLENGRLRLNGNIWYIGTINNDDSTFMVTDKVYDRAMPIDINTKVAPFECREQSAIDLNSTYLEGLFAKACVDNPISDDGLRKVEEIDDYMVKHFRISFGNRIMKQLKTFVPVFKACGGDETDAIDYFIAKKILRKLEQQNIAYIKDEFDPFIKVLREKFGKDKMFECIDYIELLKKNE